MRAVRQGQEVVPPIAGISRRDIIALGLVETVAGINRLCVCFGNTDQDGSFAELKAFTHPRPAHRYGAQCISSGAQTEILRTDRPLAGRRKDRRTISASLLSFWSGPASVNR